MYNSLMAELAMHKFILENYAEPYAKESAPSGWPIARTLS